MPQPSLQPRIWESKVTYHYAILILLCLVMESLPFIDQFFQSFWYANGEWFLPQSFHSRWKFLLYTLPKYFIGLLGGMALTLFCATSIPSYTCSRLRHWRNPALVIALSIILIPTIIGALKITTGVHTPAELIPYGGLYPHEGFLGALWEYGAVAGGKGFPAGHASGGFALMSLQFIPAGNAIQRIGQRLGYGVGRKIGQGLGRGIGRGVGLTAGWLMGLYQMARGEHFLSHTLMTMLIAMAVIHFLAYKLRCWPTSSKDN